MATKNLFETTVWYQTILRVAGGSPELIVDGEYGALTRNALKRFQKSCRLQAIGIVDVRTNVALNQVAMEWLDHAEMENPLGRMRPILRSRVKKFQDANGLAADGKVGANTRKAMVGALEKELPIGLPNGTGWKLLSKRNRGT